MRLHIRSSPHVSTFSPVVSFLVRTVSQPSPFTSRPLQLPSPPSSSQSHRRSLGSCSSSKDASPHTSLPLSTLHLLSPTRLYFNTSSALYRLCTNIYTAHAVVSRPFRLSLHALAISPLALISRALCLLNKTLPPSLPSCLRAFRPSTLVVTSTRNPAGARAFTCAPQASHPIVTLLHLRPNPEPHTLWSSSLWSCDIRSSTSDTRLCELPCGVMRTFRHTLHSGTLLVTACMFHSPPTFRLTAIVPSHRHSGAVPI